MALTEQEAAARYEEAIAAYGGALERLTRAYEPDPELRRDLLQEIHIALWRSLAAFEWVEGKLGWALPEDSPRAELSAPARPSARARG